MDNSAAVTHRLAMYYQCVQRVDASVVYNGENPGDVIAAYHPYDKVGVTACLESADITLSNTLKAAEKLLVGYIPPQIEESEYFNVREVLAGTGEWTAPDNDTDVRFTNYRVSISGTVLRAVGTAAKGGKGADASAPGKRAGNVGVGGYGGNGGGGAGGSCEFHTEQIRTAKASSATFERELSGQMESLGPGRGSDGGEGGDGIIILYYREAQVRDTGRFVDKNGQDFMELFARRFIV
jgi:hypothetical protein